MAALGTYICATREACEPVPLPHSNIWAGLFLWLDMTLLGGLGAL